MSLTILRNDITKMKVDAIVNAANRHLLAGGGVCGAIFKAAGPTQLQSACDKLAPISTGEAVITSGFDLPARYIIHTSGPIYKDGKQNEEEKLRDCYRNSLALAVENDCESIAFPLIASGIYGYPKAEALRVATECLSEWLIDHEMAVYLVIYDRKAFELSKQLNEDIKDYIADNYVEETKIRSQVETYQLPRGKFQTAEQEISKEKDEILADTVARSITVSEFQLDEPFSDTLLKIIDIKGRIDVEVYKRANIDRKLFSKIRNRDYRPGKSTIIALAVSLELNIKETQELLMKAGFALSDSILFDVIVKYFIDKKEYDIYTINNVLFAYDQPLLGG